MPEQQPQARENKIEKVEIALNHLDEETELKGNKQVMVKYKRKQYAAAFLDTNNYARI